MTGLTSTNYSTTFVAGTLTVTTTPTTTTLIASPSTPQYGDPVTLTASVSPSVATGTISFYDGSILLGSSAVSSGTATLITSTLSAGTHSITAIYNGDVVYASSVSTPQTLTVAKKTAPGGGAALTVTVQSESRTYGTANPEFTYAVSGTLVNGDAYAEAVTGVPVYASTDTSTSPAGSTFPISVSGPEQRKLLGGLRQRHIDHRQRAFANIAHGECNDCAIRHTDLVDGYRAARRCH